MYSGRQNRVAEQKQTVGAPGGPEQEELCVCRVHGERMAVCRTLAWQHAGQRCVKMGLGFK